MYIRGVPSRLCPSLRDERIARGGPRPLEGGPFSTSKSTSRAACPTRSRSPLGRENSRRRPKFRGREFSRGISGRKLGDRRGRGASPRWIAVFVLDYLESRASHLPGRPRESAFPSPKGFAIKRCKKQKDRWRRIDVISYIFPEYPLALRQGLKYKGWGTARRETFNSVIWIRILRGTRAGQMFLFTLYFIIIRNTPRVDVEWRSRRNEKGRNWVKGRIERPRIYFYRIVREEHETVWHLQGRKKDALLNVIV